MKMGGMCFNWKVAVGLVVVGVGIWVVAPNLIGAAVPLLLVAACPLSMVLMMRGMGSGQCANQPQQAGAQQAGAQQSAEANGLMLSGAGHDEQVAELKARSVDLQARHERIAREIARLEAEGSPVVREAEAAARAAGERVRG